ncbi:MAG: Maltodextrin phosphorylase [candidate division BRC1 bacterium ADurb.BinA364]|nr:MAG: Maltodextrin phosphorylase [candidate division BRC1 bacterium ADurb.BinA364]
MSRTVGRNEADKARAIALDQAPWEIVHKGMNSEAILHSFRNNQEYILAKDRFTATPYDRYLALSYAIRDRIIERWITTQQTYHARNLKRVYYLSMEFLIGRMLDNNIVNLGLDSIVRETLDELGLRLEDICEQEHEAGLGNGGLGRLAACFLDSMATLGIPAHGYGIRYEFGIFHQRIEDGEQVERPDGWLSQPNPWEFARPESTFTVQFGGRVAVNKMPDGRWVHSWIDTEDVLAIPYDVPVPGYGNDVVNTLRLWSARSTEEFSLQEFNTGDYIGAIERKAISENVSKVLYPNDNFFEGRDLRLKQEYFLVSASLRDILRRFKTDNRDLNALPDKIAIQLNDTHPALAIPEMMRLLVDLEGMDWERAWEIVVNVFAYTNHTLLPEALEKWSVSRFERLLPRHLEIIFEINRRFLRQVTSAFPMDMERIRRMSLIEEEPEKKIRMANLAVVGSHSVNGVAELHSKLLKETLLSDFHDIWPERFNNKTNGVTQRRWLQMSNRPLSALIDEAIGDAWRADLRHIRGLEAHADDPAFQERWAQVKMNGKRQLARLIKERHGADADPDSMFDIQVKRIHEYKRQLMFALWAVARYVQIKDNPNCEAQPRTLIFAGKAAPGYAMAKLIIRFITSVADVVNNDPRVRDKLRIFFLENYNVSLAERIFPGAELSEQISTAGMEASGTGNMKFALNGAATIGTLDGANVEIAQEVGEENIFIFGNTAAQVATMKQEGYHPREFIAECEELRLALDLIKRGFFSLEAPERFRPIYNSLTAWGDPFLLTADFKSYLECQDRVCEAYADKRRWNRISILNVARCGKFSSDRTIEEYNRDIWHAPKIVKPQRPEIQETEEP